MEDLCIQIPLICKTIFLELDDQSFVNFKVASREIAKNLKMNAKIFLAWNEKFSKNSDNCMSDFRIFRMTYLKIVHCVARIGAIWMQIWHSWAGFSKKHVLHFCTFAIHQNGKTNENNYNYFYILHFCWLLCAHLSRMHDFLVYLAVH